VSLLAPRSVSPQNPIAFGAILNAPAALSFAQLPPAPDQAAPSFGGVSFLGTVVIGWDFKAGETQVRKADALDTAGGKKVVGALESVPGGKALLDTKVEDVIKAATSTQLPKQYNGSP
jgi:hypothetical protein